MLFQGRDLELPPLDQGWGVLDLPSGKGAVGKGPVNQ